MLSRTLGNGVVSSYQYNANGWLTSVQHAKASQVLEKLSYGYDLVGNVTRRQVETPGREHFSQVYQYDGLHRLVASDRGKLSAQADAVEQPAGRHRRTGPPFAQSRQWQQLDMLGP